MAFSAWQILSPVQWARWTWSAVRGGGSPEEPGGGVEEDSAAEGTALGFRQVTRGPRPSRRPTGGCTHAGRRARPCVPVSCPCVPVSVRPPRPPPPARCLASAWLPGAGGCAAGAGWGPGAARRGRGVPGGAGGARRARGSPPGKALAGAAPLPALRGGGGRRYRARGGPCWVPGPTGRDLMEAIPEARPRRGLGACGGDAHDVVSPALPFPFASVSPWTGERGRRRMPTAGRPGSRSGWMRRQCGGFQS